MREKHTRAIISLPRAWTRLAADRRTIGLSALLAAIMLSVILRVAFISPPFTTIEIAQIALLSLLALSTGAALLWAWRTRLIPSYGLVGREQVNALELTAVMVVDDDGTIRHWSRGCEELYGWPASLAVGRKRSELLGARSRERADLVWQRLRAEGRTTNEVIERHRDGRELIVHDNGQLYDRGNGQYSAVVAVTDITNWRKTEDALRLSEARLATAVSVQGIFIYEIEIDSWRPIWTTPGEVFFGRALLSPGDPAADTPEYDHYRQVGSVLRKALEQGQDRVHFDFDFQYPDGSTRHAEAWARVIRDADGIPIRILGTHLDVTERRARETALRAGEAERRAILATVPDAMFVCNDRGVLRACSASACQLLGFSESELIGTRLINLVDDPRGLAAVREDLAAALGRPPDSSLPLPITIRGAGGELIPISLVIGHAMVGGARMFVVFGRDMRSTIATEERFRRMNSDLTQVARLGMMGEMAAALAHELSQPLTAIVNFLGVVDLMLDSGQGEPEQRESERLRHAITRAGEQATRAGEIVRRLRAFILRGEADMRAERLPSLVREAAALALFNSSAFGIRFDCNFESEDSYVLCDRIQIQQVLVNLIRNAADAMAAQGNGPHDLTITTTMARDNLIEVEVRDSGPGIAAEMLEQLFRPFATTKHEGLGFGLAISRRIIEAHGGQLTAASVPESGAVFRFTLQVMDEETGR